MNNLTVLILAAGKESLQKSAIPAAWHTLAGRLLFEYVLEAARALDPRGILITVTPEAEPLAAGFSDGPVRLLRLEPQPGTLQALQGTKAAWENNPGLLLMLPGDVPLLDPATLEKLLRSHRENPACATFLTVPGQDDSGIAVFDIPALANLLGNASAPDEEQGVSLAGCASLLCRQGLRVNTMVCEEPERIERMGTRQALSRMEKKVRERIRERLMAGGVTLLDPASTFVDLGVEVGSDTVLYPNVFLEGNTRLGAGCRIYPHCRIRDSVLEEGVTILDCTVIEESVVRKGARLGPFTRLRPNAEIGEEAHLGNFVEVKNSRIGRHSKAMHHSYLGDADIGENVNVGAGTITCNYDGIRKSRTVIGDNAFIGSDSQLVAPVRVGRGAYIAAGSSICEDVPDNALGIARSRQVNKEGWARQRKERKSDGGDNKKLGLP